MNANAIIDRLEWFGGVLPAFVAGLSRADASYSPPGGAWSVLQVVCHLVDEETRDFGVRVFATLRDPGEAWPPIDPEGWAVRERYHEREMAPMVDAFVKARRENVARLRGLNAPDWNIAHQHPKFGPIRAGDLLASWSAHDMLHARQIAKRIFELASRDAPGFATSYAGDWRA